MSKRFLWGLLVAVSLFFAASEVAHADSPCTDRRSRTVANADGEGTHIEHYTVDIRCVDGFSLSAASYDDTNSTIYGEDLNKYIISFRIRHGSFNSGDRVTIDFPDGYDLSAVRDPAPEGGSALSSNQVSFTGSVNSSTRQVIFTAGSRISDESRITLTIHSVLNPPAGSYSIPVRVDNFNENPSVTLQQRPAAPSGSYGSGCAWWNVICYAISAVSEIFQTIVIWVVDTFIKPVMGVFLALAFLALKGVIGLSNNITSPGSAASTGFGVTLQLANIGFVIAIIVIGFQTILHKTGSTMQKVLSRLIITAILINFSLFFAGILIDLSNRLTSVFASALIGDPFRDIGNFSNDLPSGVLGAVTAYVLPLFTIGFYTLAIFVVLALMAMFIIRYVYLSILLIILPFVLVLNIFPNLDIGGSGGAWKKWVGKFTNWLLFGPICMFFVYVAFKIPTNSISGMITAMGILVGGMLMANNLGITFADKASKMAVGGAKNLGKYAIGKPVTAGLNKLGARFGGKPGAGTAASGTPGARLNLQETRPVGPEVQGEVADPEVLRLRAERLAAAQGEQPQTSTAAATAAELERQRAQRLADLQAENANPQEAPQEEPAPAPEGPQSRLGKITKGAVGLYNKPIDKAQELGGRAADWTKNLAQEARDRAQSSAIGQATAKASSWTKEKAGAVKSAVGEAGGELRKARGAGAVIRAGKGMGKGLAAYTKYSTGIDVTKKLDFSKLKENLGKGLGDLGKNLEKEMFGEHPPKGMFDSMWQGAKHDAGLFKGKKTEDLNKLLDAQTKLVESTKKAIAGMEAIAEKDRGPNHATELKELKSVLEKHVEKRGTITAKIEQAKAEQEVAHGGSHAAPHAPAAASGKAPAKDDGHH